ncbi:DUF3572 domain-containing protein [Hyphomicrobium sp.]|jgi:hypothetical protein|uniref:DUF3572 domain-containing protein n=1 Tax=Hyphomicrobium sp. TaxID=82 RepID=UPI002E377379|nr:DUF3572 domain-containing protein [Hyphomicrobium sp.]HEX2842764.1 DUF3572 domain-containing protein [Hyphomicrobium sp.]
MAKKATKPTAESAATLALAGLAFLAEDGPRLGRFLALTGIGPDELRAAADAPETLLAVLDHLLGDESLLLVFTASNGIAPETVVPAREILARQLGAEAAFD